MVSWLFEVLIEAPLASAAAWFILAALQIYRDRWHTWTEAFFLFCCFFAGLYAIGDWLLFHSVSEYYARLSALVSLTGLTLADRKSTRLNSSHRTISYAVFCL